ncbi:hypothetical protein ON010_g3862 [Phytophthora cinnamomi]|nr:hypothetical protein ON010_g3862 [Phytophthora cinnamomi]
MVGMTCRSIACDRDAGCVSGRHEDKRFQLDDLCLIACYRALEALLATLARYFQADYEKLSPVVISALELLVQGNLHSRELETLREFKNTMNEFESQVDGVRRVLMELLDNEEDLRLLYLTKLYEDPSLLMDLYLFDSHASRLDAAPHYEHRKFGDAETRLDAKLLASG